MTFSICAFDPGTGELGIAVQSKFLAVGAVVPWARAGVGAVATRSWEPRALTRCTGLVSRLSRLAPEEIAAALLLALALAFVAVRPAAIGQLFESPFATPDPSGGPARQLVPQP